MGDDSVPVEAFGGFEGPAVRCCGCSVEAASSPTASPAFASVAGTGAVGTEPLVLARGPDVAEAPGRSEAAPDVAEAPGRSEAAPDVAEAPPLTAVSLGRGVPVVEGPAFAAGSDIAGVRALLEALPSGEGDALASVGAEGLVGDDGRGLPSVRPSVAGCLDEEEPLGEISGFASEAVEAGFASAADGAGFASAADGAGFASAADGALLFSPGPGGGDTGAGRSPDR